jgi:hypothetical protein
MASGVLSYSLTLATGAFTTAAAGAGRALGTLGSAAARTAGLVTKLGAGIGALSGGIGVFQALTKAADMETLRTAFVPLLGGLAEARERMDELSRFAAATPFELPEIAKASAVLETLTRGALSTGAGLTLVGDVASATNQPFAEIAVTIGRLYDGLQSGRPVGEAAARLQELGAISGDVRGRLEALQKEGMKGDEVWAVAADSLSRFSGSMELQSQTWNGKMSTFKDNVGLALAAFGEPIIDQIKPFLDASIEMAGKLAVKAAEFGKKVAETLSMVAEAWRGGELPGIIGGALKLGFMEAVNTLYAGMRGVMAATGQGIVESFRSAVLFFEVLTTGEFWQGMGQAIVGVFLGAISFLQRGLAEALEIVKPIADVFGQGDSISGAQRTLQRSAAALENDAASRFSSAGDLFAPVAEKVAREMQASGAAIAKRYQDAYAEAGTIFDTTETAGKLSDAITAGKTRVDEAAKKAAKAVESAAPTPAGNPVPAPPVPPPVAAEMAAAQAPTPPGEAPAPRRGLLDAAASLAARLARRSTADVARDARFGRDGINVTDRLAAAAAEARRLSPVNAAAELAAAAGQADPSAPARQARAAAARAGQDPIYRIVKSIDEKLATLATA